MWGQAADQWDKDQVSELGKTLSKLYYYIAVPCFREFFPGEVLQRDTQHCNQGFRFSKARRMYKLCEWRDIVYIVQSVEEKCNRRTTRGHV